MLLLNSDSEIAEALFKTSVKLKMFLRKKKNFELGNSEYVCDVFVNNVISRRMPVEKTFHICWVARVTLELRAKILMVKGASVLSRMIALGVLWRVSSPYSTQCLIFYEKLVVRKYFLSTDGWYCMTEYVVFSFSSFVLFFKANSLFIKFTSARNLISLRLLTLTSLFWVIVLWGSLIKWNIFFIYDGLKESLKSVTGKGCIVCVEFALTKG